MIVQLRDADDVMAAVNFAARERPDRRRPRRRAQRPGLRHRATAGVVVDLSAHARASQVDPRTPRRRVRRAARPGATSTTRRTPFGLATTGGIISTTGVGGPDARRRHRLPRAGASGCRCDNLLSADVVTADGRRPRRRARRENADLFWALRGGGGNFGVVTSLEFRLHPVKDIYGGPMFFELDDAGDVLRFYREFIADAPEQFGGFPAFQIAPPLPFIPEDRHGDTFIAFVACWAGPVERGRGRRSSRSTTSRPWSPSTSARCRTRR